MTEVTPFVSDLLTLLSAVVAPGDRFSSFHILQILHNPNPPPTCLPPDIVNIIGDMLAKGFVMRFAKGAWQRETAFHNRTPRTGRLWQRHSVEHLALRFSPFTLDFLLNLVSKGIGQLPAHMEANRTHPPTTLGDDLFIFQVYESLRGISSFQDAKLMPIFTDHALIRLAFPADFPDLPYACDPAVWFLPERVWVLEALQSTLAHWWTHAENRKLQDTAISAKVLIGDQQILGLSPFLNLIESTMRWDLARFLWRTARLLLQDSSYLTQRLNQTNYQGVRMSERAGLHVRHMAFWSQFPRFEQWLQHAQSVSRWDDDHPLALWYLQTWEEEELAALTAWSANLLAVTNPLSLATSTSPT